MDDLQMQLLVDLHKSNFRQGPGGTAETKQALMLAGLDKSQPLKIADIGCGTGASTIQLAKELNAEIIAIDIFSEFLNKLQTRAREHRVIDKIKTLCCSMDDLPFADKVFDVIWSEGAIYNMGFEAGVSVWKRFLKPGGKLIVSEITWLTNERPLELQSYWNTAYSEIGLASDKIKILEKYDYTPESYFYLPIKNWTDNYYKPLQNGFNRFLERNNNSEAKNIIECEKAEIALYQKYKNYYSYGVYIAKKN